MGRVEGDGGVPLAVLRTSEGEAHVSLHGAHVTHWQPRGGAPVLFLSAHTRWAPDAAIRGGVPVIFPWFGPRAGDPHAPAHGIARRRPWRLERQSDHDVVLALEADAATRATWPHDFALRLHVALDTALTLTLAVTNTSAEPWTFEAALHTYLAVGDVTAAVVRGLEGAAYLDKTESMARKRQPAEAIRITGEVDRIFPGTTAACVVEDPVLRRRLRIDKRGSATTVVWNPWTERARALPDLGDDDWRRMLCVETANVGDDAVTLAAGGRHEMTAVLACEEWRA
ncbi:MAG TPA: D-hexose-6-phosphate mutarotase [Candidatus Limnocylindria bacterium]|nr:D-hexose-6-phosphate mutarotase [Candidatus Limnocylindria bacterium]